jgi:L-arabinose isomerase
MRNVRVGLFGIGLDAYWPQFDGLKARLDGYVQIVADRLSRPGVDVVNLGLVDTPPKALDAGHRFRAEDVDLIFLYVTTYALSSTVLPVVRRARVPVVVIESAARARHRLRARQRDARSHRDDGRMARALFRLLGP